jgi:hypothetical protein
MSAKYTCVPDGYLEPVIGETGVAAWPAKTVPQVFKVRKSLHESVLNSFFNYIYSAPMLIFY